MGATTTDHAHPPLLELRGVTKSFPGVRALRGVDLVVPAGQVMGLVGENGAGKSTLIKILAGAQEADAGEVRVEGSVLEPGPASALAAGVAVIYQELSLVPEMSVSDNLFLGHVPGRGGVLRRGEARAASRRLLAKVGLGHVDPSRPVASFSLNVRQLFEVAKALARDARVLVMDEPTSALQQADVANLFAVVRSLRDAGLGVVYISHHLDEVFELADAATVLRDGAVVETRPMTRWTQEDLVRAMVNRDLASLYPWTPRSYGDVALEVRDLERAPRLRGVSFDVHHGEILGIAGVDGAGRTELLKAIAGIDPPTGGTVSLDGRPVTPSSVVHGLRAGIAYVPEDRKLEGLVLGAAVQENVALSSFRRLGRLGVVSPRATARMGERAISRFGIRATSGRQLVGQLSGGNQQKVVLARVAEIDPAVVLLDEPTRGIDVGAKTEIYAYILRLAEQGRAVIVVSSELPEVLGMADRVLVMRFGRVAAELSREDATSEHVLAHATAAG